MKNKEIYKLGLILAAFASVACVALAGTYALTKSAKEKQDKIRTSQALREIFPDMQSFDDIDSTLMKDDDPGTSISYAIAIKQKDVLIGIAVAASGKSYGGDAQVLVGVGLDNRVAGVKILELSDTPGLGMNAASPSYYIDKKAKLTWLGQFVGKGSDAPFEVGKDVVAVTASTISSRSLSSIIRAAARSGSAYLADRTLGVTP